MSLSIDAGMTKIGMPVSPAKTVAPVIEPSPPTTINASTRWRRRLRAAGRRAELGRPRGVEEGGAALDHVGDGTAAERLGQVADKALVAAPEADHLDSGDGCAADDR